MQDDVRQILWVGTSNGLNAINGYQIQVYNKLNSDFLSNDIRNLWVLADGTIVALSVKEDKPFIFEGLYLLRPGMSEWERQIEFEKGFTPGGFRNLTHHIGGKLYFLLRDNQIVSYDVNGQMFETFNYPKTFLPLGFAEDYILGKVNNELKILWPGDPMQIRDKPIERHPGDHAEKLIKYWNQTHVQQSDAFIPVDKTLYDPNRKLLWIRSGINELMGIGQNGDTIRMNGGLKSYVFPALINGFWEDEKGMVYVMTEGGLFFLKLQPNYFSNISYPFSESSDLGNDKPSFRGMVVLNGFLYFISRNQLGRISIRDPYDFEILYKSTSPLGPLLKDQDKLFLGRRDLISYDLKTGHVREYKLGSDEESSGLWSIYKGKHKLYLGGGQGIKELQENPFNQFESAKLCPDTVYKEIQKIYQITNDDLDRILIVSSSGLFVSRNEDCSVRQIVFRDSVRQPQAISNFTHLIQDTDSTWWLTSMEEGLLHIKLKDTTATILRSLNRRDGLITNTAYAVYPDDFGKLWISTNAGLLRLNKEDWTYRVYTTDDGLPDNEFNRIAHFKDTNGDLYFGGLTGIVRIIPKYFELEPEQEIYLRLLSITQFSAWTDSILDITESFGKDHIIRFRPGDKFFKVEAGLSDLFHATDHRFEYRFEDEAMGWQPMNGNVLTINHLAYGRHTLEIRGRNADGIYSQNQLILPVIVLRPFYFRVWFILLMIVGLVLIIREIMVGRMRRMIWLAKELEAQVEQRTRTISAQAEDLRQLQKARSQFFANISHELRTPLTLIKGPLESVASEVTSEKHKQYLQLVLHQAHLLRRRIDGLLQLSKADVDQLKLQLVPVQLNAFLEQVTGIFQAGANDQSIRIRLDNQLPANEWIETDVQKLEQILSNFIHNALRFAPSGSTISLRSSRKESLILFAVEDQGSGIHEADLEKVFDRFYTTDNDATGNGGSGIGLALSKEFAGVLGGKVWVTSTFGKGSTFYLQIPYKVAVTDQVPEQVAVESDWQEAPEIFSSVDLVEEERHSIMIVEDNRAMSAFLKNELTNYHIIQTQNGREAYDQLVILRHKHKLPDLIISDVMMPEMDGFELVMKLQKMEEVSQIPVIMLTARAGVEDKLSALRIGVDDYIAKPFSMEELRLRINYLIARIAPRQEARLQPPLEKELDSTWLADLEKTVRGNLVESQFSVSQLALLLHISERQLFRRIKALTGLTPNGYIREVRLYEAKSLLESGTFATVASLSAAVGFNDPDYFSRLYKERFGIRPSEGL